MDPGSIKDLLFAITGVYAFVMTLIALAERADAKHRDVRRKEAEYELHHERKNRAKERESYIAETKLLKNIVLAALEYNEEVNA